MTISKSKTATALLLLAACVFMPACDLIAAKPCNPEVEICLFTGNHPGTLDPNPGH